MTIAEMCEKARENALKRGLGLDVVQTLKHCSGEVLEALEAYLILLQSPDSELRQKEADFIGELADIIMCVFVIAGAYSIDMEKGLLDCLEKNRKRGENESKNIE